LTHDACFAAGLLAFY